MRVLSIVILVAICGVLVANDKQKELTELRELAKKSKPVVPKPAEQQAGKLKLKATVMATGKDSFIGKSTMRTFLSVLSRGDKLYVSDYYGSVYAYKIKGDKLERDEAFGDEGRLLFDGKIENLFHIKDGVIAARKWNSKAVLIKAGEAGGEIYLDDDSSLTSDGSSGIDPGYYDQDAGIMLVRKLAWKDREYVQVPWITKQDKIDGFKLKSAECSCVAEGMILLGGSRVGGGMQLTALSHDKKLIFNFGAGKGPITETTIGWPRVIAATPAGIVLVDSNFREMFLISKEGKMLGKTHLGKLFGLNYCWVSGATYNKEQKALFIIAANDRPKGKVADGFIFKVTGLE